MSSAASGSATATEAKSVSAWSPFKHGTFAMLWTATVVSNIGTWMQDVASGWLMTSLAPSPAMVALVQAATTLPVFLFALPAGALADLVDRRKLLIVTQSAVLVTTALLGVLTQLDLVTPLVLLAFTFVAGVGAAMTAPAWQAIVPELVPRPTLQPAIALNSLGINISRAIGPALGGFLIAAFGVAVPFFVNAVTFVGVITALYLWKRQATHSTLPGERFVGAIRAGLRYARESAPLRATLVRAAAFFVFASCYWSLLPLIARHELRGGPGLYGMLLTAIGLGAVAGALTLPTLKKKISSDHLVVGGTVVTAGVMAALALAPRVEVALAAFFCAGGAWIAVLSSLNVSAQTSLPNWVRARGLSVYLVVFFGSMALGSVIWGQTATYTGIQTALLIAASGAVVAILLTRRWGVHSGGLDLAPSMHWPTPAVADGVALDRGPVMITIEYRIDPGQAAAFVTRLQELSHSRRRDGAFAWGVFEDAEKPGRYLEYFLVESWAEHLRQHERVTVADRDLQEGVQNFQLGLGKPIVSHYLAPEPEGIGSERTSTAMDGREP
jgi:MFS family permease/branched-subunit amino acid transport protein/quinol monooxygenase YgiN